MYAPQVQEMASQDRYCSILASCASCVARIAALDAARLVASPMSQPHNHSRAAQLTLDTHAQDELGFLRIRTKKYEMMISPSECMRHTRQPWTTH